MTSIQVVQEVQRLLRLECYSHKEIGKMLGISRNTVGSVALGKHRNCNAEEEENTSVGPPRICPICGWNVLMPCVVCRTREYMSDHPLVFKKEVDAELSVDLREDHRRRYEELVSRRPQDGSFEGYELVGISDSQYNSRVVLAEHKFVEKGSLMEVSRGSI